MQWSCLWLCIHQYLCFSDLQCVYCMLDTGSRHSLIFCRLFHTFHLILFIYLSFISNKVSLYQCSMTPYEMQSTMRERIRQKPVVGSFLLPPYIYISYNSSHSLLSTYNLAHISILHTIKTIIKMHTIKETLDKIIDTTTLQRSYSIGVYSFIALYLIEYLL